MWPASRRPRLFNLLVSLSTSPLRAKIAKVVEKVQANAAIEVASTAADSHRENDNDYGNAKK